VQDVKIEEEEGEKKIVEWMELFWETCFCGNEEKDGTGIRIKNDEALRRSLYGMKGCGERHQARGR
jgi:hypothetical protein